MSRPEQTILKQLRRTDSPIVIQTQCSQRCCSLPFMPVPLWQTRSYPRLCLIVSPPLIPQLCEVHDHAWISQRHIC